MAQFLEVEFPRTIGFKAMGGPGFSTTVNEGMSGFEQRNQNWLLARGKWGVSLTTPAEEIVSPQEFIDQLTAMFLIAGGKENGFRLKDHKDFTSTFSGNPTQTLGIGDGFTALFQLIKSYVIGPYSYVRTIWKPITSLVVDYQDNSLEDTVEAFVGGVIQAANVGYIGGGSSQYTLDQTNGIIHFTKYSVWTLSAVSVSGNTATYTYSVTSGDAPTLNELVTIGSMSNLANDGTFQITGVFPTSATAGTFTVTNSSAVPESGSAGAVTIAASHVSCSAVAHVGGNIYRYSYTLVSGQAIVPGMRATIGSMQNAGNDGMFYITATGAGTFDVVNPAGIVEAGSSGSAYMDWVPASNAVVAAEFDFHFPVRFDTDQLDIQLEDSNVEGEKPIIQWASIPLRELRLVTGSNG